MIQYVLIDPKATVLDMVSRLYGDLGLTYKFIQDNSFISNVNTDLSGFSGFNVVYDDALTNITPPRLSYVLAPANPNILYWQAQPGQSIYDICVQTYGSLDLLYKFLQDNNIDGLNGTVTSGYYYSFDSTLMNGNAIYNSNLQSSIYYATGVPPDYNEELREDDSDEWREDGTDEYRE